MPRIRTYRTIFLLISALGLSPVLKANLEDVDRAEQKAQAASIERFTEFTQDKNVMGRPSKPDGTPVAAKIKQFFDRDGGGLTQFQGDDTFHPKMFEEVIEVPDPEAPKTPDGKIPTKLEVVPVGLSEHGKLSGASGSSLLERVSWQLHEKFMKLQEKARKLINRVFKKGEPVERSIFRVTTREVPNDRPKKRDPGQSQPPPPNATGIQPGAQPDPKNMVEIQRYEMLEDPKKEIRKTGDTAVETVLRAARDPKDPNNPNKLPNLTLLYEASNRLTNAMYGNNLKNLYQRRINQGIPSLGSSLHENNPDHMVKLAEDTASCDNWVARKRAELSKKASASEDPQRNAEFQKTLEKELKRMKDECMTLASLPVDQVGPRYEAEADEKGNLTDKLTGSTLTEEDKYARDLRVQAVLMKKAGKKLKDIPSAWKYDPKEERNDMAAFNEEGKEQGRTQRDVRTQIDNYDKSLEGAQEGYNDVKARLPDLEVPDLSQYKIEPESRSIMDINKTPASMMEEFGLSESPTPPPPENYLDLLNRK